MALPYRPFGQIGAFLGACDGEVLPQVLSSSMRPHLLRWQHEGYPQFHRDRTNLLIHIVAVPGFVLCLAALIHGACALHWAQAAAALVGLLFSFALQGVGHKREPTPSIPFANAGDAITRIFAEQLITFPRFVLSGGFMNALKSAG